MGHLDPHLTHDALGPCEPTTQTASRSVHRVCTDDAECPYTLQWFARLPLKIAPSQGGSGQHVIHWVYLSSERKRQLDRFSHFVGLTSVTD